MHEVSPKFRTVSFKLSSRLENPVLRYLLHSRPEVGAISQSSCSVCFLSHSELRSLEMGSIPLDIMKCKEYPELVEQQLSHG